MRWTDLGEKVKRGLVCLAGVLLYLSWLLSRLGEWISGW